METDNDQSKGMAILRSSVSVLTRGGPLTVNVLQETNPVLLKGMHLPTEAEYFFKNPINHEHNYVNKPVSLELFFGENGSEGQDISLGVFPIFDLVPAYATGPKVFEIILAVDPAHVLSLALRDEVTRKYQTIAYMDISGLEPPQPAPEPDNPFTNFTKDLLQTYADNLMKTPPRQSRRSRRGKDLFQELTISFEDAFHGTAKNIQAASTQPCPVCTGSCVVPGKAMVHCLTCEGTGMKREEIKTEKGPQYRFSTCPDCLGDGLINTFPCQKCKGNGWIGSTRPITQQIPAFIDSGAEIRLIHQGEPGQDGGSAGHLRISVQETADPLFSRMGREFSINLPVSTDFARQGGRVRVPGLEQGISFLVDLPAGTKDTCLIRVFESDDYSLTACIETYRPAFLFALPQVKGHLQEIRDRLGGAELEVPGGLSEGQKRGADETTSAKRAPGKGQSPQLADFYNQRGTLYANKNDSAHALADFSKALELDPACAAAYDNRAAVLGLQKDLASALADMEKAVELDTMNASYFSHKGMIHEYINDPEKAHIAYDKALELDPTLLDAYDRRGQLAVSRGDLQAALADFSRAIELKPDNTEIRGKRGLVYMALKEFDKAIADVDTFVEKHPNNPNGYNNRGFAFLQKNDLEKALCDYNRALELNPKLVPTRIYRGKTFLLLGRFAQAIEDLDQAIALDPKDPYPLLLIGQAYQGLGERKQAVAAFQKYLNSSQSPELCQEARQHLAELGTSAP